MRGFKAVFFDLDGTLLNTLDDIADSTNHVLSANGLPVHPTEAYKYFVGNGSANLVLRAMPSSLREDKRLFDKLHSEYCLFYLQHSAVRTKPYEGVQALLASLIQLKYRLAIITNKPQTQTDAVVGRYFPEITFDVVNGARDCVPIKPDPTSVFDAAKRTGCAPHEIFYLGDSDVDMKTGKNAGVFTAGALWGFRTARELSDAGADITVESPSDVLTILEEKNV